MRFIYAAILCLSIVVVFSGCKSAGNSSDKTIKLIPFTQELREEYKITDEEITQLQFFVSGPFSSKYQGGAAKRRIDSEGRIIISEFDDRDDVYIKKFTKCVARKADYNDVVVEFNDPDFRYRFHCYDDGDDDRYWLYGDYVPEGYVTHAGNPVCLLVNQNMFKKYRRTARTLDGKDIGTDEF